MFKFNLFRNALSCVSVTIGCLVVGVNAVAATPAASPSFCVDNVCVSNTVPSNGKGIKFHPGHYIYYQPGGVNGITGQRIDLAAHRDNILSFIDSVVATESTIKGIQLIIIWKGLEGDVAGDYSAGFAALDAILARLSKYNKYLMINVAPTVFGGFGSITDVFPAYLVNGSQYGYSSIGFSSASVGGATAKVWQTATTDRFIALSNAYGARYNNHPNMELVGFAETALQALDSSFSNDALYAQLSRMSGTIRQSWPNTNIRLGANWLGSDAMMGSLIATAVAQDTAVGGPDTTAIGTIQANQIFSGAVGGTDYRGVVPFISEVQSPELEEGQIPSQLFYAAVNGYTVGSTSVRPVRPQYFVWYYNTWSAGTAQQWSTGTLPFIRSVNGYVSNGLNSILTAPGEVPCPSGFASGCNRQ